MSRNRRGRTPRPATSPTLPALTTVAGHSPAEIENAAPGFYNQSAGASQYTQTLARMARTNPNSFQPTTDPVAFGPGVPAQVTPLDDTGEPRQWEYPLAWNLPGLPGRGRPLSMETLRSLAAVYDIMRKCIDVRKDEFCSLRFSVISRETDRRKARQVITSQQGKINQIESFFMFPDRKRTWQSWLRLVLEDYFVLDAVSIWKHRDYGGKLIGLRVLDGALIKPMLAISGDSPEPPDTAYQQYIWGIPRWNFTSEELIYAPKNVRPNSPYGMSPVEQFLTHITTALRHQRFVLDYFCTTPETEILTRTGWKRFDSLDKTEEFATRSVDGKFEWQKAYDWVDKPYEGYLVQFKNQNVDIAVTPNHTMWARQYREPSYRFLHPNGKYEDSFEKFEAEHFLQTKNRYEYPSYSTWEYGDEPEEITIPAYKKHPKVTVPASVWFALAGLFVAEGCSDQRGSVKICQYENNHRFEEVEAIVRSVPLDWRFGNYAFSVTHKPLAKMLQQYGTKANNKHIPIEVRNLNSNLLEFFLHAYFLGDGTYCSGGQRRYVTVSRELADNLQEIVQKCGREAWICTMPPWGIGKQDQYWVTERTEAHLLPKPKLVPYSGRVYCVSVPNHTIYVRHNGKPMWIGQTDGSLPEGVAEAPASWNPKQIQDFNAIWDRMLAGDSRALHKLRFVPAGFKFHQFKEHTFDPTFARWLVGVTCAAFDIQPIELGFEPMHGGLGGTGFSEEQSIILRRKAIVPLMRWLLDEIINPIIWEEFGATNLQGTFIESGSDEAQHQQMQARDLAIRNGSMSIDEAIEEDGGTPIGIGRIFVAGQNVYGEPDLIALSKVGAMALNVKGTPEPEGSRQLTAGETAAEQASTKTGQDALDAHGKPKPATPAPPTPPPTKPAFPESKKAKVPAGVFTDPVEALKDAAIQVQTNHKNENSQPTGVKPVNAAATRESDAGITGRRAAASLVGVRPDIAKAALEEELARYSRFARARQKEGKWRPFRSEILPDDLLNALNTPSP